MGDFAALLRALLDHRSTLAAPPGGWPDADFAALATLPLFHRLGCPLAQADGPLRLEPSPPKPGRAAIGTDRCVFASYARTVYVDAPLVLAFGPAATFRAARTTSPWDSCGAVRSAGTDAAWLAAWSLSAPDDERFLAAHLATVFQGWERYLAFAPPVAPDVAGVFGPGDVRDWLTTPEARFPGPLALDGALLGVLFDAEEARFDEAPWRETLGVLARRAQAAGAAWVPVRRVAGMAPIRERASQIVWSLLEEG